MVRQRGFTLIEVLVALLILTVVITTTLAVFVERQRRINIANHTILAHQILANEIEIRRRIGFHELEGASNTFITETRTELLRPLEPYATAVTVSRVNANLKRVTLAITWSSGERRAFVSILRTDTGGTNLW